MRQNTGSIQKRMKGREITWWARITYRDPKTGRRREINRRAASKMHALELRAGLVKILAAGSPLDAKPKTFAELAVYYRETYAKPPQYVGDRKIAGLRAFEGCRRLLKTLEEEFRFVTLTSITYSRIEQYRAKRFSIPTKAGKQRSIATVNRELSLLRRMLNIAVREGWIQSNPMKRGDPLISIADENRRDRVLTREEETLLLAACETEPRRQHMKAIIIAALDTGMRRGELLKLKWSDVDLARGVINVRAFNTKTLRGRQVPITPRLAEELRKLRGLNLEPEALVFGITDTCKNAFISARKEAGLDDFRFHDLRHTAATRLAEGGMSPFEIGRILGHTQAQTTYRYVNANSNTISRAAEILGRRANSCDS